LILKHVHHPHVWHGVPVDSLGDIARVELVPHIVPVAQAEGIRVRRFEVIESGSAETLELADMVPKRLRCCRHLLEFGGSVPVLERACEGWTLVVGADEDIIAIIARRCVNWHGLRTIRQVVRICGIVEVGEYTLRVKEVSLMRETVS